MLPAISSNFSAGETEAFFVDVQDMPWEGTYIYSIVHFFHCGFVFDNSTDITQRNVTQDPTGQIAFREEDFPAEPPLIGGYLSRNTRR